MQSKLLYTILALSSSALVEAAVISPEMALERAGKSPAATTRGMGAASQPKLSLTKTTAKGDPAVYVFNSEEGGFLVLSAEDTAYPILGYSDSGKITEEDVASNPALEWWLSEYARQIEYAAANGVGTSTNSFSIPATRADYTAITPMISTLWDQGAPFYNQCPLYGTERTYTGCVATAMAQVMNYWKYPEVGHGQVSYEASSIGKRLSLDFSKKKFDWENMLPSYFGEYTQAQEDAVAYLMKACGYASKMDYSTDASGALAMNIASGLKKYFDYDPNVLYTLRDFYSSSQWTQMIYDNLKNVGPVICGGGSMLGGGHSFVCDGYDGNGMFHFNWGWSGMSDGYFSLEALNPDSLGAGGGSGGGYNFSQDIVLGIQPPTGKPEETRPMCLTQSGSLGAKINPDEPGVLHFELWGGMECMWVNYTGVTQKLYFGAILEPQGDTGGDIRKIPVSDMKFTIQAGYGTAPDYFDPKIDLNEAELSDGTYKVTIATFTGEEDDAEWIPVRPYYACKEYVTLKKKGDDYKVVVDGIPALEIENASIVGSFVYGCPVKVRATIANNSDIELSTGLAPAFAYESSVCFLGESILVSVLPHSKVEKEWETIIYPMQGAPTVTSETELLFTFFDETTYNLYTKDFIKPVVISPNPGAPSVSYTNAPVIAGLGKELDIVNGRRTEVYVLDEKDDRTIDISAELKLNSGFFYYPVYGLLLSEVEGAEGSGQMAVENLNGSIMSLEKGSKKEFSTSLNLATCVPDVLYTITIGYSYASQLTAVPGPLSYLKIRKSGSAVEGLEADADATVITFDRMAKTATVKSASGTALIEVYDLQGRKLRSVANSDTLSLQGISGVVIVHASDRNGNRATSKINL